MPDLKKREFGILLILVLFTVFLGIYPSIILDSLHYAVNALLYTFNGTGNVTYNDGMTDVI
jgi:NADH-ubiquinone oxidoreductase chain 4